MKKLSLQLGILSILFAFLPIISVIIASSIAALLGCEINEGDTSLCATPLGNIGGLLYLMGVFGWFIFFTVPIGLVGLAIAIVLFVIALVLKRRQSPPQPHQS